MTSRRAGAGKPPRLSRRQILGAALAGSSFSLAPAALRAQGNWPTQIIKLVVPFTPGGSTDLLARIIAQRIEPHLGRPVVVENRPGAGGIPAAVSVARSAPDGHTVMMGHIGTLAFNAGLYAPLAYDPVKDFAAIAKVALVPNILVVHPSMPVHSSAEFLAHVKSVPGKLNYGTGGNGSAAHIATAYLMHVAGLDAVHVPYRGTAPAVNDLVGNHIQFMMTGGPAVLPLAASGQLRAIAVSSKQRVDFVPDLPTFAEGAVPGFEAVQWYGLVAPAGTPREIVEQLNALVNRQLAAADVIDVLRKDGAIAAPATAEAFASEIASEVRTWREVIQRANIRVSQ